jgi:S1/P1 Nuclease
MRWLFVPVLLFLLPKPAMAWGVEGHQIVCQIAYQSLTDKARAEVDRLLATAPTEKYRRFSTACNFADPWRAAHKEDKILSRNDDHYLNLKRTDPHYSGTGCGDSANCVVKAIGSDLRIVSDTGQSDKMRRIALTFLGHWMGDIHQPLHVSFKNDGGGNGIPVTGPCDQWKSDDLHAVWDTCILRSEVYVSPAEPKNILTDPLFASTVNSLIEGVTPEVLARSKQGTAAAWADESYSISINPSTKYCELKTSPSKPTVCRSGASFIIDKPYLVDNGKVVRERLQLAGLRLADMLNKALD